MVAHKLINAEVVIRISNNKLHHPFGNYIPIRAIDLLYPKDMVVVCIIRILANALPILKMSAKRKDVEIKVQRFYILDTLVEIIRKNNVILKNHNCLHLL